MQWLTALRPAIATALAGVLVGYTLAGFSGQLLTDSHLLGTQVESPQAHQFMVSLLKGDPDTLAQLRPKRDPVTRAIELQSAKAANPAIQPIGLTYLGGGSVGSVDVQVYVVTLHVPGSPDQMISFALTVVGGKVVKVD